MARWGRTTDIEWIYQITLDARGRVLSEVYQAPNHETKAFTGARLGVHPMLETGTAKQQRGPGRRPACRDRLPVHPGHEPDPAAATGRARRSWTRTRGPTR
jgi:hypothetical protein